MTYRASYGGVKRGTATVSSLVTGTPVTQAVVFDSPFAAAPFITLGAGTGSPHLFAISKASVTAAGFSVVVTRISGATTALAVDWIAAL